MATWKGKPFKASVEVVRDGWLEHADRDFRWEYQTTADCFSCFEGDERIVGGDYERARILWVLFDDWARSYLGEHKMALLRSKYGTAPDGEVAPEKGDWGV